MPGGSIRGVVGRITWSYYTAAALHGYTVTRSPENRWTLVATPVQMDAFKLAQRPLHFVAPHERGEWRWVIETIDVGPTELRATLGPPL